MSTRTSVPPPKKIRGGATEETIDIRVRSLFSTATQALGITTKYLRSLRELAVMKSYFIFDEKFYFQKEEVGMGLPLGPTFANIFVCTMKSFG